MLQNNCTLLLFREFYYCLPRSNNNCKNNEKLGNKQAKKKCKNQISRTLFGEIYLYLSRRQILRRKQSCQFASEKCHACSLTRIFLLRNSSETFRIKAICCLLLFRTSRVTILQSGVQREISSSKGKKGINVYSERQIWMGNTKIRRSLRNKVFLILLKFY